MKIESFRKKLRKEILIYSIVLITIITVILSLMIVGFNRFSIDMYLTSTEDVINTLVTKDISLYEKDLLTNRNQLYKQFFNNEVDDPQIYSNFYNINSKQKLKSDLLIFDSSMNIIFSTSGNWQEKNTPSNFLKLVGSKIEKNEVAQRIYKDIHGEHYLLLMTEVNKSDELGGYIAYLINGKEIRSEFNQVPAQFIISDKYDNVFASSSNQFISGSLEKVESDAISKRFIIDSNLYYSKKTKLSETLMLTVFRKSDLYPSLLNISILVVLIITFLLFIFAFFFSKKISLKNAKSVEILKEEMGMVKKDNKHRLSLQTKDEFEMVSKEINVMLEELSSTHDKNISLLQENHLAERKKLEAQFNPHFLYNTLEVIRASIQFDKNLANELIIHLTKILRYSIEEKNKKVTLENDIKYIEDYLKINASRFEYFNYNLEIEHNTYDLPVPKLFLLPIIENSLKYGFKVRNDLKITIISRRIESDHYIIRVLDDGKALEKSKAQEINTQLQDNQPMWNHHGLSNSKRRLQLMYPNSTFNIYTTEKNTIVEIRIGGQ